MTALHQNLSELLEAAQRGAILRDGLHVVIVGRPNAGKSSLLNALAQTERAIVTAIPGTTRDVLREAINLDGITLTLVDTAGLRESADEVEREGIRRAHAELARADVAILVTDTESAARDAPIADDVAAGAMAIIVHNKIDLAGEAPRTERDANDRCTSSCHRSPATACHCCAMNCAGSAAQPTPEPERSAHARDTSRLLRVVIDICNARPSI